MYTEEDFISYYNKHHVFPDGQYSNPQKVLNSSQLKTKYARYCKRFYKKQVKENSDYKQAILDAEKNVMDNDPDAMQFWSIWNEEEKDYLYKKCLMFKNEEGKIINDPAHILERGSTPSLSAEEYNIIPIPRYFHSCIDQYINPFTGKSMKAEEQEQLWRRIVGDVKYDELLKMKKEVN